MPCNSSSFFAWGILNLSRLKEELKLKVTREIENLIPKFESGCPSASELQIIIDTRNALLEKIQKVLRRVEALKDFTEQIRPYPTAVNSVILTLKALPIPNQFTTAGLVVTFGDLLADAKELVKSIADGICDFDDILGRAEVELGALIAQLQTLDLLIAKCSEQTLEALPSIQGIRNVDNTAGIGYKGYIIKIQQDAQAPAIAPRRYAVAYDKNNVAVLKGQPSFSSSTQILIDEIKFRIDQLLS
jgi:hypothetical protein